MHLNYIFSKGLARSLRAVVASLLVSLAFNSVARAQTITGGWYGGDPTDRNTNPFVVTFLSNNTFFLAHDGIAEDGGMPGMEFGTYTWNSSTGEFTASTGAGSHTTGNWGFGSSLEAGTTLNFSGNSLSLLPDGESEPMVLSPVTSSSSLLVGSFLSEDGAAMVTFLDSGHYYIAEFGVAADGGQTGMEHGTYQFASGVLTGSIVNETNGSWGFGSGGTFNYTIADLSANGFTFIDGADQVAFTRIGATAVPEPSTYALMFGAAALGWATWRRKAARK